jgi:hypothetical protein
MTLQERLQRIREAGVIRAWEYRQRNSAKGVWYRLRRALVDAAEAYAIDDVDADRFQREGETPLAVGRELAPPKRIFFLPAERLRTAASRRRIPVRLGGELLQARNLVLIAHGEKSPDDS